jgi:thiamine biosynthesis protein ThiS
MQVIVNGREEQLEGEATISVLLGGLGVEPRRVAVEVNEDVVSRRTFDTVHLRDGDRIEIVTFVGGG